MRRLDQNAILEGLLRAARGAAPPTTVSYDRLRSKVPELPASKTILRHYGSWRRALRAAGYSVPRARTRPLPFTLRELAARMATLERALGRRSTNEDWDRLVAGQPAGDGRSWPQSRTVRRWFGTLGSLAATVRGRRSRHELLRPAVVDADVVPFSRRTPGYADADLDAALRRAAGILETSFLTVDDYRSVAWRRSGEWPAATTVIRRYGSWTGATARVGLESGPTSYRIAEQECADALRAARRALGRWPIASEYERLRKAGNIEGPDHRTLLARLGGRWPRVIGSVSRAGMGSP